LGASSARNPASLRVLSNERFLSNAFLTRHFAAEGFIQVLL
jgi:hypothetical protein